MLPLLALLADGHIAINAKVQQGDGILLPARLQTGTMSPVHRGQRSCQHIHGQPLAPTDS